MLNIVIDHNDSSGTLPNIDQNLLRQLAPLLQSNEQPSEEDIIAASTARESALANLKKIDRIVRREGIVREKEVYDSILSPIRRLSSDVLGEIFLLCMPMSDEPIVSFGTAAPWNVASVCRAWYHAAVAFSPLWIKHDFHFPSYGISARHSLRRLAFAMNLSAGRGLHGRISIEADKHFCSGEPLFSPLMSAAPRLEKLTIKAPLLLQSYEFRRIASLLHNVKSLDIRVETSPQHYRLVPDFLQVMFPQGVLSSLAIDIERFWSKPSIRLSWESIQHLTIRASEASELNLRYISHHVDSVVAILARVSQIQTLTVDIEYLSDIDTYPISTVSESPRRVALPALRDLNWRISSSKLSPSISLAKLGAEIKTLVTPCLKNLSLDVCSTSIVQRTLFSLGRSQCALTKLSLAFPVGITSIALGLAGNSILSVLRHEACHSLESLSIMGVSDSSQAVAHYVVSELVTYRDDAGQLDISSPSQPLSLSLPHTSALHNARNLLPHLRTFTIDISDLCQNKHSVIAGHIEDIVVKMAVSRYCANCLQRATINVPHWFKFRPSNVADLEALKRDGFEFYLSHN